MVRGNTCEPSVAPKELFLLVRGKSIQVLRVLR